MKPQESQPAAESPSALPVAEGELPDWIMNIGTGAISAAAVTTAVEQPDWLNAPEEPSAVVVPTPEEQLDWSKDIEKPAQPLSTEEQTRLAKGT